MVLKSFAPILWVLFFLAILPTASALPNEGAFPNITFREFNIFVEENFGSDVSWQQYLWCYLLLPTIQPCYHSMHDNRIQQFMEKIK